MDLITKLRLQTDHANQKALASEVYLKLHIVKHSVPRPSTVRLADRLQGRLIHEKINSPLGYGIGLSEGIKLIERVVESLEGKKQ